MEIAKGYTDTIIFLNAVIWLIVFIGIKTVRLSQINLPET